MVAAMRAPREERERLAADKLHWTRPAGPAVDLSRGFDWWLGKLVAVVVIAAAILALIAAINFARATEARVLPAVGSAPAACSRPGANLAESLLPSTEPPEEPSTEPITK